MNFVSTCLKGAAGTDFLSKQLLVETFSFPKFEC